MNVLEGEFPEVRLQDPARRVPPRGGKAANGSARASRRVPHPRGGARSVAGSGGAPASNRGDDQADKLQAKLEKLRELVKGESDAR
jgi:hypothetical protein